MRKGIMILILFLIFLTGCSKNEIKAYEDFEIEEFNEVLKNIGKGKTKAYDLREHEECVASRIPGFLCARFLVSEEEKASLDRVVENLAILLGNKKRTIIILMDNDGSNSKYVAEELLTRGYTNIHYFLSGYESYVRLQPDFIPESGDCDC